MDFEEIEHRLLESLAQGEGRIPGDQLEVASDPAWVAGRRIRDRRSAIEAA